MRSMHRRDFEITLYNNIGHWLRQWEISHTAQFFNGRYISFQFKWSSTYHDLSVL